jgi:DNA-binding PadR family transcriptional regulator
MLNKNGENWIEAAIEKWRMTREKGEDFELNNHYWTKLKSIYDIWK